METFALAAISFTIAISLLIRKKKNPLYIAFASLCLALFLQKTGTFFSGLFSHPLFQVIHHAGALSVPPLVVACTRLLIGEDVLPKRLVALTAMGSAVLGAAMIFSFGGGFGDRLLFYYLLFILAISYVAIVLSVREKVADAERKRIIYMVVACTVAALLSLTDVLAALGYGVPLLADMAVAALLYFILVVITHSELPEFYEIMARAFIVFLLVLFSTTVFFLILGLFGKGSTPEFTAVFMASLLMVIALDPLKMVLRKTFAYLFPESKDIFTSLYGFDEELEREKSVLLEEMATGLAHEIRNPLGSIKGAAQYLQSEADNGQSRKLLDVIIEEVDRLNRVVSQFLNYAKPFRLNLKRQDINAVIEKAVSLVRANNLSDRIGIETDLNPSLPPVDVDAEQMIQVILNIAFNAIEAMPDGGTLMFRTSRIENEKGEAIGIAIRDTGGGIGKEDVKNIFKPFFTTKDRGIGLGLAICQRIIKNHGGYIRVKSIPGQGSIFYIRIGVSP
jgi:two-component system sensor histidine kinase HydH